MVMVVCEAAADDTEVAVQGRAATCRVQLWGRYCLAAKDQADCSAQWHVSSTLLF